MEQSIPCFPKQILIAFSAFKHRNFGFRRGEGNLLALILFCLLCFIGYPEKVWADLSNQRFGKIELYKTESEAKGALIFFSGENGFDSETKLIASEIAKSGFLVIGISSSRYLEGILKEDSGLDCSYLAGEITRLNQTVQSAEKLGLYSKPLLFGIGSGASLAYTIAAQYPDDYKALVSVDFCPVLPALFHPCEGAGLRIEKAHKELIDKNSILSVAWKNYETKALKDCSLRDKAEYFKNDKNQLSLIAEKVSVEEIVAAVKEFSTTETIVDEKLSGAVADLPLIEIFPQIKPVRSLMLFISGDGGWATIDKELARYFKAQGYAVLGLNALKYFWKKKDPDEMALEINRALDFYRNSLGVNDISLLGFSLGADTLPFLVNRLNEGNKEALSFVALLSPGKSTDFEVHVGDWLGIGTQTEGASVVAEIQKINFKNIACIYGAQDQDQSCTLLDYEKFILKKLPGDHHFDGHYDVLAKMIMDLHKP